MISAPRRWTRLRWGSVLSCGFLAVWIGVSLYAAVATDRMVERTVYLMGTRATLVAAASSRTAAVESLNKMLTTLEDAEDELSTWRAGSVLSRLNRQPVDEAWAGPEWLCDLLSELEAWSELTEGAFDPGIGSLIDAWDLRGAGRRISPSAVGSAQVRMGVLNFSVRGFPCFVTRRVDATIDAGGFGKGLALDRVAEITESGFVDLGGQVAVFGRPPGGSWPVTIAHPQRRDSPVVDLRLTAGSLAVSGGSERDRRVDGQPLGHIVDPRTGSPITRTISVAVWHERAMAADVLATALYVMGEASGHAWAERINVAACFLIPGDAGESDQHAVVTLVATTAFRSKFPDSRFPS